MSIRLHPARGVLIDADVGRLGLSIHSDWFFSRTPFYEPDGNDVTILWALGFLLVGWTSAQKEKGREQPRPT